MKKKALDALTDNINARMKENQAKFRRKKPQAKIKKSLASEFDLPELEDLSMAVFNALDEQGSLDDLKEQVGKALVGALCGIPMVIGFKVVAHDTDEGVALVLKAGMKKPKTSDIENVDSALAVKKIKSILNNKPKKFKP